MDWLANVRIEYVVAAIVILFIARLWLARYKTPIGKSAAEVVESALVAIILVFLIIRPFFIQVYTIRSASMEPTLREGDHILLNKLVYRLRPPRDGEIIVFRAPKSWTADGTEREFIKRLVGVPGDLIAVKNGKLLRNGKPVDEPYIKEPMNYEMDPIRVPRGKLFVMGDNRNNSNDSVKEGLLDLKRVLGKSIAIFWPPNRARIIK
ncbi:MAG: signal peptidase I [Armatimonadota bacterium]|nr:signal peptidase I [Armatimonadota bacterium]